MDRQSVVGGLDASLLRFSRRLRDELGAEHVLLFGSYARGNAYYDSDYDLIIVAEYFETIPPLRRQAGLRGMFYEVGGHAPMDLICVTPEEFETAKSRVSLIAAVLPEAIDLLEPETAPA
jgi:predicted nucleotidyltransferase